MSVQHLLHFVGIVLITEALQGDPDSFLSCLRAYTPKQQENLTVTVFNRRKHITENVNEPTIQTLLKI